MKTHLLLLPFNWFILFIITSMIFFFLMMKFNFSMNFYKKNFYTLLIKKINLKILNEQAMFYFWPFNIHNFFTKLIKFNNSNNLFSKPVLTKKF